ncbi:mRNA binding protein puf3 [Fusarium poae]
MTQRHWEERAPGRPSRQPNHMSADSHPPPSTFGGHSPWGPNHYRSMRDNGDRSHGPYPTSGWPRSSDSPPHSSSPNNRSSRADTNDMSYPVENFPPSRTTENFLSFPRQHAPRSSQDLRDSSSYGFPNGLTGGPASRQEPTHGASHTPSSSINSQPAMRYIHSQHVQTLAQQAMNPQQAQALNMQAFSFNNAQALDQQSAQFSYHSNSRSSSSQLNPASQTWNQNITKNHASRNSLNMGTDLTSGPSLDDQLAAMTLMDQGSSTNTIAPFSNTWSTRDSGSQQPENQGNRHILSQPQFSTSSRSFGAQPAPYGLFDTAGYPPSMVSTAAAIPPLMHGSNFGNAVNAQRHHNPSAPVRHPFSIQFSSTIANNNKNVPFHAVFGWVVIAAGDCEISRFIQSKLITAKSDEKDRMFTEIGSDMISLMKDLYGNYVIQKLIEHGSMTQKMSVIETVRGHIVELSLNTFGCRVFQKIVECCPHTQVAAILDEIHSYDVLKVVMYSETGNHVIQKLVQEMPQKDVKFITVACQENARELSENQYSCRILQRVLEKAEEDDKKKLVAKLSPMMHELVTHQWGNYVAGHIIQNRGPEDRDPIYEHVMSRLLALCQHKLASHVVEKCIVHGTDEQRTRILERLCPVDDSEQTFENMFKNQIGNYVVTSLLKHLKRGTVERAEFKQKIIVQYDLLKATGRTLEKLDRIFEEDRQMESRETKLPSNLQIEVDSAGPTPVLTNETNSPQSDSLPSADASTIEYPRINKKTMGANPRVRDDDDA